MLLGQPEKLLPLLRSECRQNVTSGVVCSVVRTELSRFSDRPFLSRLRSSLPRTAFSPPSGRPSYPRLRYAGHTCSPVRRPACGTPLLPLSLTNLELATVLLASRPWHARA